MSLSNEVHSTLNTLFKRTNKNQTLLTWYALHFYKIESQLIIRCNICYTKIGDINFGQLIGWDLNNQQLIQHGIDHLKEYNLLAFI